MVFLCESMMILLTYRKGYTSAVPAFTRLPSYIVTQPCISWLLFVLFGISLQLQTHWIHSCFQAHLPCFSLTFGTLLTSFCGTLLSWLPKGLALLLLLVLVQISYPPGAGFLSYCSNGFAPTITTLLSRDSELIKMFHIIHFNSVSFLTKYKLGWQRLFVYSLLQRSYKFPKWLYTITAVQSITLN